MSLPNCPGPELLQEGEEPAVGMYAHHGGGVVLLAKQSEHGNWSIDLVQTQGPNAGGGGGSVAWVPTDSLHPVKEPRDILLAQTHFANREARRLKGLAKQHEKAGHIFKAALSVLTCARRARRDA